MGRVCCHDEEDGEERDVPFGALSDEDIGSEYPPNTVKTSKYTCISFLPKNLGEQFMRLANVYFLVITVMMFLAPLTNWYITPIDWLSTGVTLIFMMTATMVAAAIDDCGRHHDDAKTNGQPATVVRGFGVFEPAEWQEVVVGDVLMVKADEEIPADLVLLACSSEESSCFVSTANLDGETNLKIKELPSVMQRSLCGKGPPNLDDVSGKLDNVGGVVTAEPPTDDIHSFTGSLRLEAADNCALDSANVLLRGTTLRNTQWAVGLVVYTGKETRIVMNSRKTKPKLANIEHKINLAMIVVVGFQVLLALLSDVLFSVFLPWFEEIWYLFPKGYVKQIVFPNVIGYWFTFFILYSNLLPISLYFTMEMVNAVQAYYIKNDLEMYDHETDTPAKVRSGNLCQELGQISHIFSDKTGTLTQNVMELKRISVNGKIYGQTGGGEGFHGGEALQKARESQDEAKSIDSFLEVLAISHTVMVTTDENGRIKYEAESPDEGALVGTAAQLGWSFQGRTRDKSTVRVGFADKVEEKTYTILATNAFNSTRKRASVVVQTPGNEIVLLVKGADNIMIERATGKHAELEEQLLTFSKEGLRTLVLGRRKLDQGEFNSWKQEYDNAVTSIQDRSKALEDVAEKIEKNIEIVGATAIEDKLQEGVARTIEHIRRAGIKLWVLTGDKLETARNIGFSTSVLDDSMNIIVLDLVSPESAEGHIGTIGDCAKQSYDDGVTVAMLITGKSLQFIEDEELEDEFLEVSKLCSVLIACRVSPLQKATVVKLVRNEERPKPLTLAIGDGANDVPMIQEAHVGVGICGKEGRQAVNASDFAIAQFRFLERLLLIHGAWNYRRICKFVLYTFWKNAVLTLIMFYYTFASGFSGTSIFESFVWTSFNFILALPIICVGIFDREVSKEQALEYPGLYGVGREGVSLNLRRVAATLLSAVIHSLIIACVFMLIIEGLTLGGVGGYYSFGTAVFTGMVISCNYGAAVLTTTWNFISVLAWFSTLVLYLVFLVGYGLLGTYTFYFVPFELGKTPILWISMLTVPLIALMVDFLKQYLLLEFFPDRQELILEEAHMARDKGLGKWSLILGGRSPRRSRGPMAASRGGVNVFGHPVVESSYDFDYPERASAETHMRMDLSGQQVAGGAVSVASGQRSRSNHLVPAPEGEGPRSVSRSGGSDASTTDDDEAENYPNTSRFAQQDLPACQFVLNHSWMLCASLCSGILLGLLGLWVYFASSNIDYLVVQYVGEDAFGRSEARREEFNYQRCDPGPNYTQNNCTVFAQVPYNWDADREIKIHYMLNPYYQNYFNYLYSVVGGQILDREYTEPVDETLCPAGTRTTSAGDEIFPCGLQATSLFTDSISIDGYSIDWSDIAWPSDKRRFANPSDYPNAPDTSYLFERYPTVVTETEGIRNEHFMVWMRPAGLPEVVNSYGTLIGPTLKKGQNLTIRISSSYPLDTLDSSRTWTLTTEGALGGRNFRFGVFLLCAASFSFLSAFCVCCIRITCPRQIGKARVWCCMHDDDDGDDGYLSSSSGASYSDETS